MSGKTSLLEARSLSGYYTYHDDLLASSPALDAGDPAVSTRTVARWISISVVKRTRRVRVATSAWWSPHHGNGGSYCR